VDVEHACPLCDLEGAGRVLSALRAFRSDVGDSAEESTGEELSSCASASPERSQDLQPPYHRRTGARMRGLGDQHLPCADVLCRRYSAERIGVDRAVAVSRKAPRPTTVT
jgi:hypothetical protein